MASQLQDRETLDTNFMYDFGEIVVRRGTNCVKWDAQGPVKDLTQEKLDDIIPMWVADMDFRTAPCVTEAVTDRAKHGVFGYTQVPEEYYVAVIQWFAKKHDWKIKRSEIIYTSGVVPAMSAVIKALTVPGDKVLLCSPSYNCFFSSILNNGCTIVDSPLLYSEKNGIWGYEMDWKRFENCCADPEVKLFLMCNPHNPAGKMWTREDVLRIGEICRRHDVIVLSDEIHCELASPGHEFVPFAGASEANRNCCVVMNSPSKAFNTAGLQIANIITSNPDWLAEIDRAININEVCDVNPFGVAGLIAAYTEGDGWLAELNAYIRANYLALKAEFERELPEFHVTDLQGTYLVWIDCRSLLAKGITSDEIEERLIRSHHVWVNAGSMYGTDGFIRINIATPRSRMLEGVSRIIAGLKELAELPLC